MSFFPNKHLVPIKIAIKYDPPTLALFYKVNIKDRKKRRYNIFLNQLAFLPNPHEITEQLYCEHKEFLNEQNVEYAQIFKMVEMIFHNFRHSGNQQQGVDSYIQTDNEIDKSVQFENEQELYYSSYNPRKDQVYAGEKFEQLDRTPLGKRQRIQNFATPSSSHIRLPDQLQSTNMASINENANDSSDLWMNKPKQNLNLSLSGMQQFMEKQGSSSKFATKQSQKQNSRQNSNSPQSQQAPVTQLPANFNNLNNRQQQQLRNQINMQNENDLNIANFVEEGVLQNQGQMFIDDQMYQSPSPQRNSKYVAQQIQQNQQYYLQQNNNVQKRGKQGQIKYKIFKFEIIIQQK